MSHIPLSAAPLLPGAAEQRRSIGPRPGLVLVLLACAVVYWPRLGATGLWRSEGHRVLPAWEMLDRGEWLVPRLFGQVYLRKPPGMSWAVAASSAVFGRTEFAARAVSAASATLMALAAFAFATRWFGLRWGAAAGLASALMPMFWDSARSAEIESLNNLGTQVAVLAILDLLLFGGTRRSRGLMAVAAGAGLIVAFLAKGPASAPCLGAAVASACLVRRSLSPLLQGAFWAAIAGAGLIIASVAWAVVAAVGSEPAVAQAPSDFLWGSRPLTAAGLLDVLKVVPESLVLALPVSLAMLFPFGRACGPSGTSDAEGRGLTMARGAALACLLSLGVFLVLGVDNPRYTFPAYTVVPLVAAWVVKDAAGGFEPARRRLARLLLLGHPGVWCAILLGAAIVYITIEERSRTRSSGRDTGIALAAYLPDGAVVWADGMVEARPEVLHYAIAEAAREGRRVTARWLPGMSLGSMNPASGTYALLRADPPGEWWPPLASGSAKSPYETVTRGRVHRFEFVLVRMLD